MPDNNSNNLPQFDYKHLDIRTQFFARMSGKILRDPDAAYTFMNIVCNSISIAELPTIEILFNNSVSKEAAQRNN